MQRARIEHHQRRQAAVRAQLEAVREANTRARAIHAIVWEEMRQAERDLRVLSRAVTPRVVRARNEPAPKGARRKAPPLNTAPPSPAQLRRARARVLVLLAALAEPGLSLQEIARRTRLDPETVRLRVADLAAEDMLVVQGLNAGRGRRVFVYPVPAPDEEAAARLHALTSTQHASRADIRSVSA